MAWAPDYVDLLETKAYLRVPGDDTADDGWIADLITAASQAVNARCHRQFGTAVATRVYEAAEAVPDIMVPGTWLLVVDDIRPDAADTIVTVGGVQLDPAGYVLLPRNAPADARPYTTLRLGVQPAGDVAITTGFGWPQVPKQVRTACLVQIARWHVRRESPYGIAGSPDLGSEQRLLAKLDPDVAVMLVRLSRVQAPR
jgi:hypothetical protein